VVCHVLFIAELSYMACQYRARTLLYIGLQRPISIGCRPIVTVMLYTLHTRFIIVGLYYMNTVGVKTFDSGQRGQGRRHEFEGKGGGVNALEGGGSIQ